jgi:hypothetical protein
MHDENGADEYTRKLKKWLAIKKRVNEDERGFTFRENGEPPKKV